MAGAGQRVGGRQPGQPGADHDHVVLPAGVLQEIAHAAIVVVESAGQCGNLVKLLRKAKTTTKTPRHNSKDISTLRFRNGGLAAVLSVKTCRENPFVIFVPSWSIHRSGFEAAKYR